MYKEISYKNIDFKKRYGQNFINDMSVFESIVSYCEIDNQTLVIEIGPGAGVMTDMLCHNAKKVIAFEVDESLKNILEKIPRSNLEVIYRDFLKVDLEDYLKKEEFSKLVIVGNLPYYITSPILEKLVELKQITKAVIMVQKEVGHRICARENSKEYNAFTLWLRYYFNSRIILEVNRSKFSPAPKVDSVIVELVPNLEIREAIYNRDIYFKLIKDAFRQKRKNLRNNLMGYNQELFMKCLDKYNLDLTKRAEEIPEKVFVEIANNINETPLQ